MPHSPQNCNECINADAVVVQFVQIGMISR
jgi:hypothetical protein